MSLRICHLADIHLGYRKYTKLTRTGLNQREVDVSLAFRECIDRIIVLNPDAILIAGDLFHQVRPSNAVVTFCFRELRRLAQKTGAPIIIIAGNHETPKRVDSGCILRLFTEIPGVYVADTKSERFSFPEKKLSVLAVPHAALLAPQPGEFRSDERFKYNILLTHAQVGERWMSEFGGATIALDMLSPHEWDYVALGHVHVRQEVALGCWYAGAIEHTANDIWSESREQKGFLEVDVPAKRVTAHNLTSPRLVVPLDTIDGMGREPAEIDALVREALDGVAGGIEGKILRLEVINVPREIFRRLNHRELRALRAQALHLALEIRPPQVFRGDKPLSGNRRGRLEDDLREYCAEWRPTTGVETSKVFEVIKRYIHKAEGTDEAPLA